MSVNKPHLYEPGIYFVTFTNYRWLQLFEITQSYDLVYKWFDVLKNLGHYVTGYVIMPNHLHVLIAFTPGKKSINTIIGNGKRFIAYGIIERLKNAGNTKLLLLLEEAVSNSDKIKGKLHEVFQPGFDAKLCHSYKFINQKLNYIHSNPISKKWMLTTYAFDYAHSSAGYYMTGKSTIYEVMDIANCINLHWFNKYTTVPECVFNPARVSASPRSAYGQALRDSPRT